MLVSTNKHGIIIVTVKSACLKSSYHQTKGHVNPYMVRNGATIKFYPG